jgi:hypothetical protein
MVTDHFTFKTFQKVAVACVPWTPATWIATLNADCSRVFTIIHFVRSQMTIILQIKQGQPTRHVKAKDIIITIQFLLSNQKQHPMTIGWDASQNNEINPTRGQQSKSNRNPTVDGRTPTDVGRRGLIQELKLKLKLKFLV